MTASVLVTGGGSGIGAAVALAAGQRGDRVAVLDVDGAGAIADQARHAGAPAAVGLEVDVRDEAAVEAAIATVTDELGVPTAVLANAGIEVNAPAHELEREQWDRTLDTNLTGAFLTARHAIRALLGASARGSLVLTSSPSAFVGFAGGGNAAYAASKGGISALVRSLALDYAPHGIRVNAVVPGATDTPLLAAGGSAREELVERARHEIPLGRLAAPSEVAEAVLWLWSDAASYVTGSHLVVDGGLMAKSANTF